MGLLDYNTRDGRFRFMLPWEKHTLVGTTDTKGPAETLPNPPEAEVEWLLPECGKSLSPALTVRRSDVLSAWSAVSYTLLSLPTRHTVLSSVWAV